MVDSKIFELAHHFRIESNRNGRFEFESNLEASQVPNRELSKVLDIADVYVCMH